MAKKRLKCRHCSRTFAMPAHLARHERSAHNKGGGSRATAKSRRAVGAGVKSAGRATAKASGPAGKRVVADLQAMRNQLEKERNAIDVELHRVDEALKIVGSLNGHSAGTRAPRSGAARKVTAGSTPKARRTKTKARRAAPTRKTTGRKRGPGRPKGSRAANSLASMIVKVVNQSSKPMGPKDISAAVKKAGYKSKSDDLSKAVSNALPTLKEIQRVGFGKYAKK